MSDDCEHLKQYWVYQYGQRMGYWVCKIWNTPCPKIRHFVEYFGKTIKK